jgi:predicted MFS family arabinose efflux permease
MPALSERRAVLFVAAVQFVNILDFMMVMPLGPDFSKALGIPLSDLPIIGGSYTGAACVSGLVGALFLDRFDRRPALFLAMCGLFLGTVSGAFATGLGSLVAARVLAGVFGGPATSLSLGILADAVPPQRRGKAMGAVMGAFAAASVLGVPFGLELARRFSWRTPFWVVGLAGAGIAALVFLLMPPMRKHLEGERKAPPSIFSMLRGDTLVSLALSVVAFAAAFMVIPSISGYLTANLGYPRERLWVLYMSGGTVSFFTTRIGGRMVDKVGAALTGSLGSVVVGLVIFAMFVRVPPAIPIFVGFVGFMLGMGLRNVSVTSLSSKVPLPAERARFGSLQSAAQHFASFLGALVSSRFLAERPDGTLSGMGTLSMASIGLSLLVFPLLFVLERRLRGRAN